LSVNLARLTDKVLVVQSRIGTAQSREAPQRSGGAAKPLDGDGPMRPPHHPVKTSGNTP